MFQPRNPLIALSLILFLAACGGDDDDDDNGMTGPTTGDLRFVHAVPDAPAVDITATPSGGSTTTPVEDLDFAETSGFLSLDAGTYDLDVLANLPDGDTNSVLPLPGQEVTAGQSATAVAIGTVDDGDGYALDALLVNAPAVAPSANQVSIVVGHASSAADTAAGGDVDVYVTAPGVDVSTQSPTFSFGYGESVDTSDAVGPLTAGEYQIQITPAGSDTVVYDSGTVDLSPFAGSNITLLAVNAIGQVQTAASPVKLLAVVGGEVVTLLDAETQAGVKVAHVSPDAGNVDVTANGSVLLSDVPYLGVSADAATYNALDAGAYDLNVQGAGSGTDVLSQDFSVDLAAGTEYSVLALGNVGDLGSAPDTAFDLTATVDENRSIATQASVKVVHGAPDVGQVDVYVTPAGTVSVADIEGGMGGTPLLEDFAFRSVTDYVAVAPGDYDIRIADPDTNAVLINVEGQTLAAGAVVTAIARQGDGVDGTPSGPGLLLLTN